MKPGIQACISLLAAFGLSYQAAAWAAADTSVSKLPIKASIFAKPNVIMGVDNSGSMDSEVIVNGNDGAMWWDTDRVNDSWVNGAPDFNDVGASNSKWRKYTYLFPNGNNATARLRTYGDAANDHFAVMPTSQFAWLRSSRFNSLYYNPNTTYLPWQALAATGYNFTAAAAVAARPHPLNTLATDAWNLTTARAPLAIPADHHVFTAFRGMTVPTGARIRDCDFNNANCGAWQAALSADTVVPANRVYRVAMPYNPATYWQEASCTLSDNTASVADRDCVMAPDGVTRLQRVQILATDTAQMQNFANWFQYHRKRILMLNAAMGEVLESLTGINGGFDLYNNSTRPTRIPMFDLDSTNNAVNGQALAKSFYDARPDGGTPTRQTLLRLGQEFAHASGPIGYACQRNAALIVTDGFANIDPVTVPTYTPLAGVDTVSPYAITHAGTIADIALSYYRNRLRTDYAAGRVARVDGRDENTNLHMNTYGLTLGARGQLFTSEATPRPTLASAWINPPQNRHPSSIDDLWHATINGRGQMYLANNTTETVTGMIRAFNDIKSDVGSQGSAAVNSVNLGRGNGDVYLTSYNPSGWVGDVAAYPIDPSTAQINYSTSSRLWSASELLLARPSTEPRQILTMYGGAAVPFSAAAAASAVAAIVNPAGAYGNSAAVMDYLRGSRSGEQSQPGGTFRNRTSLIGPVVNSEPVVSRDDNVLFVQSGEGMLHAFSIADATPGKELWAFVPRAVQSAIGATTRPGYVYSTKLDGQLTLRRINTTFNLLVGGMGAAGRSYHGLNVHAPNAITEASVPAGVWEFPTAVDLLNQAKMGLAMGKPRIVNTAAGLRVLVTSGYETLDGRGRMWVLNPADGTVLREFLTPAGSVTAPAELAHVTAYLEDTGTVQYVYGGDLQGNLWRFDLNDVAGAGNSGVRQIASLRDADSNPQPVTAAPELTNIENRRVVVVATGRLLSESDLGATSRQSVYAIADTANTGNARAVTGSDGIVAQTYSAGPPATISDNPVNWTTQRGWYFDMPAGEQVTASPQLARGTVLFASNTTDTNCGASSKLYAIDITNGGPVDAGPDLSPSTVISTQANVTGLTILQASDGRLYVGGRLAGSGDLFGQPTGAPAQTFTRRVPGDITIAPKVNAWRESRSR